MLRYSHETATFMGYKELEQDYMFVLDTERNVNLYAVKTRYPANFYKRKSKGALPLKLVARPLYFLLKYLWLGLER
jgi:hypothetical protein